MKKRIFGGIAVLGIAAAIAVNVNLTAKNDKLSDLVLANVEALAAPAHVTFQLSDNGGDGGGTSAEWCFKDYITSSSHQIYVCHSGTNDNKIYPCPSLSYGLGAEGHKDRCTK